MTRSAPTRRKAPKAGAAQFSTLHLAPDSLGFALDCAALAVGAVRTGTALPAALAAVQASMPAAAAASARGAIQDLAYRTLRRLGTVDWLVGQLVNKAPPAHVGNVLSCALALLIDDERHAAYTSFTVVDQAVTAIGARRECVFAKGLVNAVLRNFLREREAWLEKAQADAVAASNYPLWWAEAVRRAWPDAWQRVLAAGNAPGPLTLRVNARRSTVAEYLQTLDSNGIAADAIGPYAVRLATPLPVDRIPGFSQGVVSVQDAGAQLAAERLDVRDGMRVLDACAAPGGKTGHILELADVDLVALESDPARAARIEENLTRLGLRANVTVGDAGTPAAWHDGQPFDRILADVPCSASGIVRRHPDVRWLRRATDIPALVTEQRRILDALWPLVAPGGELLYVTCSIFPEECEEQARWFESTHEDAVRLDAPGQLLPAGLPAAASPSVSLSTGTHAAKSERPGADIDHDGFYYARFQKR
ncbi:16S rRNA (cytosine(967)-C(5))-methyltransferase RsmB [Trinickia dinghuensis]|uniref:16S rRNA (Cytosine(967)-C(5))-methyltransferase RsmB n=1 Tax=Trinickia dinghuensis TaxID=2291023 RepID=A0A3D8K5E9_9BURK|nr:16S rRNA (cytosine(967)-C(5))-methyltransferase RsmB [Trinickia dinghuensis]RDV00107.1 16S rRNA (cytosine(967)-C(5))-methyltransferase RsmB [Trinickia dinghuensis]